MCIDDGSTEASTRQISVPLGVSIVDGFERRRPESELSLLQLLMTGITMLLLVYGMALLVVIEFTYRHLVAAPSAWLLRRLAGLAWRS
jgi:hypothetical protein